VAFCDGSAKFIKDSVTSWDNDPETGLPIGLEHIPYDPSSIGKSGIFIYTPGMAVGVLQEISTRNGGEVIPAGAY
jgi:hypothetical protein